ncbi:endonuclease/exonuclease/phosphatase family protein [Algoriphagus sp. D3-2-R+10]|uniref:endonuclease/exonuclease/phosphatase family protein n=1 Tax=Algoriphagus aurantiacus TaxID=3103948 RepID=UPI002B36678E|nr:endonuclease/exonuclease/phosphatase family protein [Algoriphagus sp. D3-2-R+10]MEB2777827.1 endonuclease/exonuclease/phosphatase family protein [Algoriphagus sp. D3-2-R+10]
MKSFKNLLRIVVITLSMCVIVLSLLSLFHDLKLWYFKILDFPRFQYLIIAIVLFVTFLFLTKKWRFPAVFLCLGLLVSIVIQGRLILPYYLGEKKVPDATVDKITKDNKISALIANVLVTNKNSQEFLQLIKTSNPDLILAMEVDNWWIDQLQILKNNYPYFMEFPLDNAYGMALYSKLRLTNDNIIFLNQDDVPSFHAEITLNSGESIQFHGVHPVAPVPSDRYPDNVGKEEVALAKVGDMVSKDTIPVIVAGDFNDVSWSDTSRLFEKNGDLKNVRIGRGIYSSFDVNSPFLRWPLDHFFVTKQFSLSKLERLPGFGSDHFPMLAEFVLLD